MEDGPLGMEDGPLGMVAHLADWVHMVEHLVGWVHMTAHQPDWVDKAVDLERTVVVLLGVVVARQDCLMRQTKNTFFNNIKTT